MVFVEPGRILASLDIAICVFRISTVLHFVVLVVFSSFQVCVPVLNLYPSHFTLHGLYTGKISLIWIVPDGGVGCKAVLRPYGPMTLWPYGPTVYGLEPTVYGPAVSDSTACGRMAVWPYGLWPYSRMDV